MSFISVRFPLKSMIKKSLKQEKRKRKEIFSEIRRKSELCYATSNKARILKLGTPLIEPVSTHMSKMPIMIFRIKLGNLVHLSLSQFAPTYQKFRALG